MDYEKKYKEALSTARKLYNMRGDWTNLEIESIFPELRENEDERIRKKIIATIHLYYGEPLEDEAKEMIDWLEKQGKYNIGISEATKKELENNLNKALEKETPESWNEFLEKQGEQKPQRMVSAEAKEAMYNKPTWSEEDEKMLNEIVGIITGFNAYTGTISVAYDKHIRQIEWLKSLRPKSTWKPTDEQIEALDEVYKTHGANNVCRRVLFNLMNDLKKLKEE